MEVHLGDGKQWLTMSVSSDNGLGHLRVRTRLSHADEGYWLYIHIGDYMKVLT